MLALDQVQQAMMRAIALGPDHVPSGLFRGTHAAALRGLSVHANTISHARLVALEDSFPRTRTLLGEAQFNTASRDYLDQAGLGRLTLSQLGQHFADWLHTHGHAGAVSALAGFEWAWLQCYHAAEATPFTLDQLAGLGEAGIAELVLARHPASAVLVLDSDVRPVLSGESGALIDSDHLLLARPDAEVLLTALTAAGARLYGQFSAPQLVCNLLAVSDEPAVQDALINLITQGALVRIEETAPPC